MEVVRMNASQIEHESKEPTTAVAIVEYPDNGRKKYFTYSATRGECDDIDRRKLVERIQAGEFTSMRSGLLTRIRDENNNTRNSDEVKV